FVGSGGGTPDETGVSLSGRDLGFILFTDLAAPPGAAAWSYAFSAHGSAELVGVDGLTLSGDLAIRVNTTGRELHEVLDTGGGSMIALDFGADEAQIMRLEGSNIK